MIFILGACVAAAALLMMTAPSFSARAAQGTVEIRVTDHRDGIEAFRSLIVVLDDVAFHATGSARDSGWLSVMRSTDPVDIVPLKGGLWAALGRNEVAAGDYDAVRVRFASIHGVFRQGPGSPIVGRDSALAAKIRVVAGVTRAVLLDFYVEDQTDHEPRHYVVKLRRVEDAPAPIASNSVPGPATGEMVDDAFSCDTRRIVSSRQGQ
ncbi:MAG: DUF4382 domain-containing protein [Proteobacteria bacterium]|nr:DUF4382 domain-containing protein [Pseudomonadota bacterium]